MSYENAPATRMLASHCACCGRPLVDAKSVECGVGPECRKKHGYEIDVDEDARVRANIIVCEIALQQTGPSVVERCAELHELGFDALAQRILRRLRTIIIDEIEEGYSVWTPFEPEATQDWRRIPGRRWNSDIKRNEIPREYKRRLWELLRKHHNGLNGIGPKGAFVI